MGLNRISFMFLPFLEKIDMIDLVKNTLINKNLYYLI